MNYSIYSRSHDTLEDRGCCVDHRVAIAGLGLSSRVNFDAAFTQTAGVAKAGKPLAMSSSNAVVIR
jgi:hypothetical protein